MNVGRYKFSIAAICFAAAVGALLLPRVNLRSPEKVAEDTGNDTVTEVSLITDIAEQDGARPDASDAAELSDGLCCGTGEWPTPPTTQLSEARPRTECFGTLWTIAVGFGSGRCYIAVSL
jgi:hypothetical protein